MLSGSYSDAGIHKEAPKGFDKVVEGFAAVLFPPAATAGAATTKLKASEEEMGDRDDMQDQSIFYNPAQVVNRDLSVSILETFSRMRPEEAPRKGGTKDGITVLEALSATGLRAIRYWKEVSGVRLIIANDLDADAVDCISRNLDYNEVPKADVEKVAEGMKGVCPSHDDAVVLMQRLGLDPGRNKLTLQLLDSSTGKAIPLLQKARMDVIDLDPYGSASPFMDSAMQAIKEGGLLLVTCTDSAILCGNYPETCFGKYGSTSLHTNPCHEFAVRIVLAALERSANRHRKYIVPLLSLHIDFYVRVFCRVYTQPAAVKLACCKLAMVASCTHCSAFKLQPLAQAKAPRGSRKASHNAEKEKGADANDPATATAPPSNLPRSTFAAVPSVGTPFQVVPATGGVASVCSVCGCRVVLGGPIYAAPTHDRTFLQKLLSVIQEKAAASHLTAVERVTGLVRAAMDELPDTPLFYVVPEVASVVGMQCPSTPQLVGALRRLGYRCSQVHCNRSGLKTDAPPETVFGVMLYHHQRQLSQAPQKAVPQSTEGEEQSGERVAATTTGKSGEGDAQRRPQIVCPAIAANFVYDPQYDFRSSHTGVAKFIPNEPYWGPKRRHQGVKRSLEEDETT